MGTIIWFMSLVLSGIILDTGGGRAPAGDEGSPVKVVVSPARRLPGERVGFEPVVAADGSGRVVTVGMIHQDGQLSVWKSENGGKTFTAPRPLLPEFGHQPAADPTLVAVKGQFYLCFMFHEPGKRGMDGCVLRSADGGKIWNRVHRFSAGDADIDRPILAISPSGRHAAIVCTGAVATQFSSDGGVHWVSAPASYSKNIPGPVPYSLVIDDRGRTTVSYMAYARPYYRLKTAFTRDGGKTWLTHDLGPQCERGESSAAEDAAGAMMQFSGAALALDGAGAVHALAAQPEGHGQPRQVWYRSARDGGSWSKPVQLSSGTTPTKFYPALAAAGTRLHATWVECQDGWCQVCYRGSLDGGKTWSRLIHVSRPERASVLMTDKGFRVFSGHYMGVAEDGRGLSHIVWGVAGHAPRNQPRPGELWHASVRLVDGAGAE
jgi:photosystem II stability/assembly factor-like uncharacterized protein